MAIFDKTYKQGLREILEKGQLQSDPNRKRVKRLNIPSLTLRHEIKDGFPALTIRKIYTKLAWAELSMFLSGSRDIRDLWRRGVNFWDKDVANFHGITLQDLNKLKDSWKSNQEIKGTWSDIGKIYPYQYRSFGGGKDQITSLIQEMKTNPLSSSLVVNTWNPNDFEQMSLKPCHYGFQILGRELSKDERDVIVSFNKHKEYQKTGKIPIANIVDYTDIPKYGFEIHWQQRSTDFYLGTPYNVLYYSLLGILLEHLTGHKFLAVQGDLKNVHLYDNAIESAKELIKTDDDLKPPQVELIGNLDVNNLENSNFSIKNYNYKKEIKVEMLAYNLQD